MHTKTLRSKKLHCLLRNAPGEASARDRAGQSRYHDPHDRHPADTQRQLSLPMNRKGPPRVCQHPADARWKDHVHRLDIRPRRVWSAQEERRRGANVERLADVPDTGRGTPTVLYLPPIRRKRRSSFRKPGTFASSCIRPTRKTARHLVALVPSQAMAEFGVARSPRPP